jgi:hypothetical protein
VYFGGAINLITLLLSLPFNIRKFKGEKLRLFFYVVPQKKWAADFSTYTNAANHPEMMNFVKFHLAIPAHNREAKRVL